MSEARECKYHSSTITSDDRCRTNWSVCVDTSEITNPSLSDEGSSLVVDIKQDPAEAKERVVALIYFLPAEFSFENSADDPPVGKAQIVACRNAFRQGAGGSNIMKGLFGMVHDRARVTGCAFMITSGIPSYGKLFSSQLFSPSLFFLLIKM